MEYQHQISASESTSTKNSQAEHILTLGMTPLNIDFITPKWTLWLHVKWKTSCYYLYAEYYFEAWITSTEDSNGPRVAIDQLDMRWRHGGVRGREVKNGVDMVAKDDRTYATGFSCDTNLCTQAIASHQGVSWSATTPDGCEA